MPRPHAGQRRYHVSCMLHVVAGWLVELWKGTQ